MPSIAVTIDQLDLSPYNVRTDKRDTDATSAMEQSLLEEGQLLPLVVHPLAGSKGRYGVLAGGRRYRSFRNLIGRGQLPATHPIDIVVREGSPAKLIELSTTENLIRRDLRSHEVAAAVLAATKKGRSADDVARALGQEPIWVRQQLRFARLAPPIFEAFADETIAKDLAAAFAATEDHELQLVAFEKVMAMQPDFRTPTAVRSALRIGDREVARLLTLVGDDTYAGAGGRFELDLFAGEAEQRGRVVDEALLRRLADEALAAFRDDIRARAGRPDLRFVTEAPRSEYGTDWSLALYGTKQPDGSFKLPEGDVVAQVKLDEAGKPDVDWWWASRKAKHGNRVARAASRPSNPGAAIADVNSGDTVRRVNADLKEETGVTADGVEIFRSLRRMILRAGLIWDARAGHTAGLDFLIWSQIRVSAPGTRASEVGSGYIAGVAADPQVAAADLQATGAHDVWEKARQELLARPAFAEPDLPTAFRLYRAEAADVKQLAAAVVAGMALERSMNGHGYVCPVHDVLADQVGLTGVHEQSIRQLWAPTPELLRRFPREQLIALAEPYAEPKALEGWRKLRGPDLPAVIAQVLEGASTAIRTAGLRIATRQWVHPFLRFARPGEAPAPADTAQLANADQLIGEAAE